jgi:NAD(P)-dependent dehydrogenase (short-subunit alcohol dehydrogenase family)
VALVTGAASGLGRAVARRLAEEGLVVYASDADGGELVSLEGLGVHTLVLDVTSDEDVARALGRFERDAAEVDLLVNVAGILRPGALEVQPMREIDRQFAVNALGPLRVARALAPAMRRRGFGRIVNVSSTNGFLVTPFMGAYSASKFALEALSDSLRLELAPWGVEVGVIQPGAMRTPFADRAKVALEAEIATASEWTAHLEGFLNGSLWGATTAASPERVARRVVRVALSRRLRPRTLGTVDAAPARLLAMFPDALKDLVFARAAGLRRRRPRP